MRNVLIATAALLSLPTYAVAQPAKKSDPLEGPKRELQKARIENDIADQETRRKLRALHSERQRLAEQHKLMVEKQKLALAKLAAEKSKLELEDSVATAKHKRAVALMKQRTEAEELKLKEELATLRRQKHTIAARNAVKEADLRQRELLHRAEKQKINMAMTRMKLEATELKLQQTRMANKVTRYKQSIQLRDARLAWRKQANKEPNRSTQPFQNGTLVVSDRRIPLNGPIVSGVASYVTDRIHYFNNKSTTEPIFLVIDSCPGGSVMQGYRIVKAIETSKAPVHVVVKSFAASMAAVITTLADHSYAYPNAIILHHEMSTFTWGNMTQLAERLKLAREWERRLMGPVAKKLGISVTQFRQRMYKSNSDGDWEEFADRAHNLKWVGHIVHRIRETGVVKQPGPKRSRRRFFGHANLEEKRDTHGKRYVELPRLHPYDLYFIHNPDNYYR